MSDLSNGEINAIFRPVDSVQPVQVGSTIALFTATGALTNGQFGLFRWDMPRHARGASPHYHRSFSESFYVLSGTPRLYDGAAWVPARAGDFMFVPELGVHGFRNESDEPASMLILFTPGAPREAYFEELAEILASGRTLGDDEWTDLYARHDQYMVG
jgi:quercetin dioxygenase-like cupin family protein